ncbi:MAG: hypothetical protein V1772_06180 [Chloroflexota bacterium]
MPNTSGKGLFAVALTALGTLLALVIYQVPQPWRGVVVGWLLFAATLGPILIKVLRHHYAYKAIALTRRPAPRPSAPTPRRTRPAGESLKVVMASSAPVGRHTIR